MEGQGVVIHFVNYGHRFQCFMKKKVFHFITMKLSLFLSSLLSIFFLIFYNIMFHKNNNFPLIVPSMIILLLY